MIQRVAKQESLKPFVVGLDRHSSHSFSTTNNFARFPDIPESVNQNDRNDTTNYEISRAFSLLGIDCIFVHEANRVLKYMRDHLCRALLFHARVQDYGDTTKIILSRRDELLLVFLYNESELAVNAFAHSIADRTLFTPVEVGLYQARDGSFAAFKPSGVTAMMQLVSEHFRQI